MNIEKKELERLVRQIINEKINCCGVKVVKIPEIPVRECDRLDTGNPSHKVYTRDVFDLDESPRLGCGIMEMTDTTFDCTLSINCNGKTITANAGEVILIPKGSSIQFSVSGFSRFLYVTYPADWQQK